MDFTRLFDLLPYQDAKYSQKRSLCFLGKKEKREYSTAQLIESIDQLSCFFIQSGLKQGDIIAVYAATGSPEWNIVDFAAMQIGMVSVALHNNYLDNDLEYVLTEINAKVCFVSHNHLGEKLQKLGYPKQIFSFEKGPLFSSLDDILLKQYPELKQELIKRKDNVKPVDLAMIVYTSGSTGLPKGVMLSHYNIVSNIKSCLSLIPLDYRSVVASFLPLGHIFERTTNYICMALGASIWYVEDKKMLINALKEIRPQYMSCVPRILESVYSHIKSQIQKRPFIMRRLLNWAMSSGKEYSEKIRWSPSYQMKKQIANILLYRKWRIMLGGRLKYVGVGGAALDPVLGRLYSSAGIKIREGYGMTECSPVISMNRFEPGGLMFGTVGIPIPGMEVKILEPDEQGEGEILVKGPSLMLGYYKNPGLTKNVIKDGWFHTGDLGKFINKRFLKISGRKKNMFKTTSGRYVVPEKIENLLNADPFIDHSFAIGDARPYVSVLIVPEFSHLEEWAREQNVHWTAPQYMVLNPRIEKLFQELVEKYNVQLKSEEQIKQFQLIHDPWDMATGELTSTLKIKRKFLLNKYEKIITELYES